MKRRTRDTMVGVWLASSVATGTACAEVVQGQAVPASSTEVTQEVAQPQVPEDATFPPLEKSYNPSRAKAEACLFRAVQVAAIGMDGSSETVRRVDGLVFPSEAQPTSTLINRGVSEDFPVRMAVDFDFTLGIDKFTLRGITWANAQHNDATLSSPAAVISHINPQDGKSYMISDETRITNLETTQSMSLGEVNSEDQAWNVCGMVEGVQATPGFVSAAKDEY